MEKEPSPRKKAISELLGQVGLLGGMFVTVSGVHNIIDMVKGKIPLDPKGKFEVLDLDGAKVTLKQGKYTFTVENVSLSEEVKKRILEKNPELKSFLDNGPINVISPQESEK